MRKGKEILWGFCFLVLAACASFAQSEVSVKYGGPSGQGTVIWYAPSTGVTNMVLSTNGTSFGPVLDNLVVAGDITAGGATATGPLVVNTQLWLGTNGYFQITGKNLEFVCPTTAFTNTVVDDITQ